MNKFLSLSIAFVMVLVTGLSVNATTTEDKLSPEQKAVIADYETTVVSHVETVTTPALFAVTSSSVYRGSFYRGSALMWSEDFVEWSTSGSSVTSSTAWQKGGFIFPNIVRLKGIPKHSSSSSSVTYRGEKTIGAGVVTPWGDVTVYETDYTDFLRANANGTMDVWQ